MKEHQGIDVWSEHIPGAAGLQADYTHAAKRLVRALKRLVNPQDDQSRNMVNGTRDVTGARQAVEDGRDTWENIERAVCQEPDHEREFGH